MHHKRGKKAPSKDDTLGRQAKYQEVKREDIASPAKLPSGYCKKLKGGHDFHLDEVDEDSFQTTNGRPIPHTYRFEKWHCVGCGKKRRKMFRNGRLVSSF